MPMICILAEINGGACEAGILNEIRIGRYPSTGNLSKRQYITSPTDLKDQSVCSRPRCSWATSLAQLLRSRQGNRTAVFVFLDVVPHELVLQPGCLTCSQVRIGGRGLMGEGEAVAALCADDRFHQLIAGRWRTCPGLAQALGDPVGTYAPGGCKAYHRGSRGWRACPR